MATTYELPPVTNHDLSNEIEKAERRVQLEKKLTLLIAFSSVASILIHPALGVNLHAGMFYQMHRENLSLDKLTRLKNTEE